MSELVYNHESIFAHYLLVRENNKYKSAGNYRKEWSGKQCNLWNSKTIIVRIVIWWNRLFRIIKIITNNRQKVSVLLIILICIIYSSPCIFSVFSIQICANIHIYTIYWYWGAILKLSWWHSKRYSNVETQWC